MKLIPGPKHADPWLTPREAAERMLEHHLFPRPKNVIYAKKKQIEAACREHTQGRPGINCDQFGKGEQYTFRLSELERWVRRNAKRGLAYVSALEVPARGKRR